MLEAEILNLCQSFKDKVIALKQRNEELKTHFKQAKEYCDTLDEKLKRAENESAIKDARIAELEAQLSNVKQQSQETSDADKAAKEAFMQELSRVIEDANTALED